MELSKFDKHMGKPLIVQLKNEDGEEDTFTLYPLGYEYLSDVFSLIERVAEITPSVKGINLDTDIESLDTAQLKQIFSLFDKDTIGLLGKILVGTMRVSYPDLFKSADGERKANLFITANLFELLSPVLQLNTPRLKDANRMKEISKEMKKLETEGQSRTFGQQR